MNGIIYYTKIRDEYNSKNMEHMIGEKLLEIGLEREFGRKLAFEPRSKGEHGKPFFTLLPRIHYNITHSGKYVMCLFAGEEVGIDVQIHKKVNYERILERMVPADMIREILDADDMEKAFFTQWVLREAYIQMDRRGTVQGSAYDFHGQGKLHNDWNWNRDTVVRFWSRDSLELRF